MANKRTVRFGVGFSVNTFIRARWGEEVGKSRAWGLTDPPLPCSEIRSPLTH